MWLIILCIAYYKITLGPWFLLLCMFLWKINHIIKWIVLKPRMKKYLMKNAGAYQLRINSATRILICSQLNEVWRAVFSGFSEMIYFFIVGVLVPLKIGWSLGTLQPLLFNFKLFNEKKIHHVEHYSEKLLGKVHFLWLCNWNKFTFD